MIATFFDTGLEGWTDRLRNGTDNRRIAFDPGEGAPVGAATTTDRLSGTTFYFAPESYLGDRSGSYGGTLSFDLRQIAVTPEKYQYDGNDVILEGGEISLAIDAGDNPGTGWTSYSVALDASAPWRIDTVSGPLATEAQIRAVLSDLTALLIRGEFVNRSGSDIDRTWLDNVEMSDGDPPEIAARFDADAEGWSLFRSGKTLMHKAGGFVEAAGKKKSPWYFDAPDAFLGDQSTLSGGTLGFDLRLRQAGRTYEDADFIVEGAAGRMVLDIDTPTKAFSRYEVTLDTRSDWRLDTLGGTAATQAQMDAILADVDAIRIRGDYGRRVEKAALDNVVLTAASGTVETAVVREGPSGPVISGHATWQDALDAAAAGQDVTFTDPGGAPPEPGVLRVGVDPLSVTSDLGVASTYRLLAPGRLDVFGSDRHSIAGSAGDDTLQSAEGPGRQDGRGGDDRLIGGTGANALAGGPGADTLLGKDGDDRLEGGPGDDRLFGGTGQDALEGGHGHDLLVAGRGTWDALIGGTGDDTLMGGRDGGTTVFSGLAGNDLMVGAAGTLQFVYAGTSFGNDTIMAGEGPNHLQFPSFGSEAASISGFLDACSDLGGAVLYDADGDGRNTILFVDETLATLADATVWSLDIA